MSSFGILLFLFGVWIFINAVNGNLYMVLNKQATLGQNFNVKKNG